MSKPCPDIDLAYTAGILDGEGCICITKRGDLRGRRHPYIMLEVIIVNTQEWLGHWLRAQFGGTLKQQHKLPPNKDLWVWNLTNTKASEFLELLLPFIHLKRPQAELAISFQHMKNSPHRAKNHLTEEEATYQESVHILMCGYNNRGI